MARMARSRINRAAKSESSLIEDVDGRTATAEDFRVVLIDRRLDSRDIYGGDDVAGVPALGSGNWKLVKKAVGVNHVVDDAALRNLLGLELGFDGEIAPIVVAEMIKSLIPALTENSAKTDLRPSPPTNARLYAV